MPRPSDVSRSEVIAILRAIANGTILVWSTEPIPYCGNAEYVTAVSIQLVFFIDCDELDYLDFITIGDRTADFDDLWDQASFSDPIDQLTPDEQQQLEDLLFTTPMMCSTRALSY
ncbi:DUF7693 family protein [Pantanalinema sp. GBBB05]|uniref:DUF7693 family protein n=1 Tax=Pantanalinema sp. GBBB05 TaxID=2604139 RepID=UPI001D638189|nr:hypothetical protein [Pantanalinema sp. GBBB05]